MTTNIESADDAQTDPDGESQVIADFRKREKELKAQIVAAQEAASTALVDAHAQVRRENEASQLMSNAGFSGLSDVFASEVDGDLTPEAATAWLEKRGLTASSETSEQTPSPAEQVGDVADLGAQIAAVNQGNTPQGFEKRIAELEGAAGGIDSFNDGLAELLNQQ